MEKEGLNVKINQNMASQQIDLVKENQHLFEDSKLWNLEYVYKSKTCREFDERFLCHQFGYSSAEKYYDHGNFKEKISQIKVPCLALNALDDPISPKENLPFHGAKFSDYFTMLTTSYGGHIGFWEGSFPKNSYNFSERVFEQFFNAVFNKSSI